MRANLISTKMSPSHRKSTQGHSNPGQTESQEDPSFQLASTCESVWQGLNNFLFCNILAVFPEYDRTPARGPEFCFYIFTNSSIIFSILSELQVQPNKETRQDGFSRYHILLFLHRTFQKLNVGIDNCR